MSSSKKKYLFESERLGFRNWIKADLDEFARINADFEVMEYFPKILTKKETAEFMARLGNHFTEKGYSYFATEILKTGEFIGFIGLTFQDYKTNFTPAVDIGWRLKRNAWGKGYATEGAKKCLEFGFRELNLDEIISTCTKKNFQSENVMKKLGMKKIGEFNHPKLLNFPGLKKCICYGINRNTWMEGH